MADINLKGMGVALITPFKEDEECRLRGVRQAGGLSGAERYGLLVVLVLQRKLYTYGRRKRKIIISLVVTRVRGRIPIVLGVREVIVHGRLSRS